MWRVTALTQNPQKPMKEPSKQQHKTIFPLFSPLSRPKMTYVFPILYFIGYAILHSLLAMDRVKALLHSIISPRYYRLLYSTLSTILLIPLYYLPWPHGALYHIPAPWAWVLHAIQIMSFIGFWWTIRHTDTAAFLGWAYLKGSCKANTQLITSGPYRLCRHPLYFFGTLIFVAHPHMSHALALITLWLLLYFWIGSYIEERRLVQQFGDPYLQYQATTPRLIPFT